MTDKTEAQPEALRLEVHQECADFATSLRSAANVVQLRGQNAPPSFLKAADLFEKAASEIQQLKAQLSARQDAPDGQWKCGDEYLPYHPDASHVDPAYRDGWNDCYRAAPPAPERVPLSDEQIEKLRKNTFSTDNPFCPCDRKTMQKAVWAAERAHGIGATND